MPIRVDYHTHTRLCKHAEGEPSEYLAAAAAKGLIEYGFSDHFPAPANFDSSSRMEPSQYPEYRALVKAAQANPPPGLAVRYGAEVDWVRGRMDEVYDLLAGEDFDYLIGSIHYVGDFGFDNDANIPAWAKPGTADHVWDAYGDLLLEMVGSGKFDVIGHIDLPKKFGCYPKSMDKFLARAEAALESAARLGVVMEINAGGLRKPVKEAYPSLELLKLARAKGVLITFGSDCHCPADVASGFDVAENLARAAGYQEYQRFDKRRHVPYHF